MENPYDAPLSGTSLADNSRRPVGVSIVAVLAAILGLVLLSSSVVLAVNWREHNEWALNQRLVPSSFWVLLGPTIVLAFTASVGVWRGRKWGWWITCCGLVLFVIDNFGRAATANLVHGVPFTSVDFFKYAVRGIFFAAILAYWLRTRVRKYFHTEQTGRIKAIVLAAVCGIGIVAITTVVLRTIFLYRTR